MISRNEFIKTVYHKITLVFVAISAAAYIFKSNQEKLLLSIKVKSKNLNDKNNSMSAILNNIQQGIITINKNLKIDSQYSRNVDEIFETNTVKGIDFISFLLGKSNVGEDLKNQIKAVLNASFGEKSISFEMNEHILPKYIVIDTNSGEKNLEISWNTIKNEKDEIYKILVTIKDFTEIKLIKEEEEKKSRSIQILTQLLVLDQEKVSLFFNWCDINLSEAKIILDSREEATKDDTKHIFRILHTLKGTARMFTFSFLVDLVHIAEQKYSNFLTSADNHEFEKMVLIEDLESITNAVDEYKEIYERRLLSFSKSKNEEKEKYEKLSRKIISMKCNLNDENTFMQKYFELYEIANKSQFETVEKLCGHIFSSMSSLASETGKKDVNIKIFDSRILFDKREAETLSNILIHCLRNSLDHGIEKPEDRISKGKPKVGTISLNIKKELNYGVIEVEDDGGGLNLNRLKKKGTESAILDKTANYQQIANIIFYQGVSTAERVTELSGRGVGMDAVKNFLKEKGGNIKINLKGYPDDEGKVPFSLLIYLPKEYFFDSSEPL